MLCMICFMQIAVVLEDDQVEELDRLVPAEFPSRAAVVRAAIANWLNERRSTLIDDRYEAGYSTKPPEVDDIDSGRVRRGNPLPAGWQDLDW